VTRYQRQNGGFRPSMSFKVNSNTN